MNNEKLTMKKDNIIHLKTYAFALRIIKLYRLLVEEKKEFIMSKQLLRSGTAIGALVKESEFAQSKADFINKMHIALKEANETEYWLMLLKDSNFMSQEGYNSIYPEIKEIISILVSIVKSTKASNS